MIVNVVYFSKHTVLLTEEDLFRNIQMVNGRVTSAHGFILMCGTARCYESLFCVKSSPCQINQKVFGCT